MRRNLIGFIRTDNVYSKTVSDGTAFTADTFIRRVSMVFIAAVLILLCSFVFMQAETFAYTASAAGKITAGDYAALRKSSTVDSKELARLDKGTSVIINKEVFRSRTSTKRTDRWYYVSVNGSKGYIRSDLVKITSYDCDKGVVTKNTAYRKGAGTAMSKAGTLKKGTDVSICLLAKPVKSTAGSSPKWYRIKLGSEYYYVSAGEIETGRRADLEDNSISEAPKIDSSADKSAESKKAAGNKKDDNPFVSMTDKEFDSYLKEQGFPKAYRSKLKALHKKHPNWRFRAFNTGIKWKEAVSKIAGSAQIESGASMNSGSYTSSLWPDDGDSEAIIYETASGEIEQGNAKDVEEYYREFSSAYSNSADAENAWMSGSGLIIIGSAQAESWVKASSNTAAFFMDPRNFLTENRIYMFEDLSYDPDYQTKSAVGKILEPTKLPGYGFTAKVFVNAGKKYDVSPVHLASRARQETGGGSIAINGSKGVYNPFNIGAYSSVTQGITYARNKGWTTPQKSVNGGAKFISSGYINNGQNTIYFQRFDVTHGISKVGTHVYMTNIRAPFFEATSTKTAYKAYGITKEALTFIIPVYKDMPASTSL